MVSEQFVSSISYFLMRWWWCPFYFRPKQFFFIVLASSLKKQFTGRLEWTIFNLYHSENTLLFDEMMMIMSVLESLIVLLIYKGLSWSWSYCSWIYNYQSVPITTKVVSSYSAHGEVYSIQHYVIKFVSNMQQVCGFLWVLRFPPLIILTATIKLKYCWVVLKHHKPT